MKHGQKVVAINDSNYWNYQPAPKKGEILTIDSAEIGFRGNTYLTFVGYDYLMDSGVRIRFNSNGFSPLEYSGNAISEILEKFKPEECRPDVEVIPEKLISNH